VWDVLSGYDSIVTAMGNDADESLYFALKGAPARQNGTALELYRIGDCVAPRKVDMAIHEGYTAGKRV
jgi:hypothetical protein